MIVWLGAVGAGQLGRKEHGDGRDVRARIEGGASFKPRGAPIGFQCDAARRGLRR